MAKKLTYEELEQRVQELEEEVIKHKHADEELLILKDIFDKIQIGLHIYHLEDLNDDKTLKMISANQASADFTGVEIKDVVGKWLDENFPDSREKGIPQLYSEVVRSGESKILEDLYYGDNRVIQGVFSVKAFPVLNDCVGVSFENITERKEAEERIHNLSRQLLTSPENERQKISYELHESVAQDLSSSRIICEMILKDNSLTPGVRKQISELSGILHKTLNSVRDLSYELLPPGLKELGLTNTMDQFCEDFSEKTGVRVDFQSAGIGDLNLNYNTRINLYRLLQEGLNNVRKHADASNAKIRLISSFPNVILRIYDDGKGFDLKERLAKTSREKRMGLSSMEQRAAILMGRIDIESSPGKGTKVVIKIPHKM
jgi:signal transduction histidine kinase